MRPGWESIQQILIVTIEVPDGLIVNLEDLGLALPRNWNARPGELFLQHYGELINLNRAGQPYKAFESRRRAKPEQLPIIFSYQRLIQPALERARVEVPRLNLGQENGPSQDLPPRVILPSPRGGEGGGARGRPLLPDLQLLEFPFERCHPIIELGHEQIISLSA